MNVMKNIRIEKVTLNIGAGGPGDKLDKSAKLLTYITGKKPVQTETMERIPTWNVRPHLKLASKITIRKKEAHDLLKRLLKAVGNKLSDRKFDNYGNFSFGIPEYIDVDGIEYNAQLGMFGFDVAVTLERPGFRIKKRKLLNKKIPTKNKITKQEAMDFIRKEFNVKVGDEE
ncbi:MAG: 50S ribosomal protein L5 [Candidatus Nanoarchaeia archaeon]|nr:50S ribosomal protein L5 [Candidatus Nanoarchaeia archaeon]